jgi:hypothetical protein
VSDVTSTGGHGTTCRQDVLGRVDVPVVQGAAGRATPRPGGQRELGKKMPARRAGLGAAGLLAGRPPLIAGQVTLPSGQAASSCDLLSVGGGGEILDSQIHPEHRTGRWRLLGICDIKVERDGEEVHERGVLVPERLLEWHAGHHEQEPQAWVAFQLGQVAVGLGVGSRAPSGCGSGSAAMPGPCSTSDVRSRTYGSTPPPAPGWGRPAPCSSYACSRVSHHHKIGYDEQKNGLKDGYERFDSGAVTATPSCPFQDPDSFRS